MKMASRSIISTVCYPSTERSKYSNCTVNPGQTRIFYKAGQTRMTRRKCDPDDPDDPTRFQPWYVCMLYSCMEERLSRMPELKQ